MGEILRKFKISRNKLIAIIVLVIIVLILPLTIFLSQQQQETRSKAATLGINPVGQSGSWSMVFNDEFDGNTVDLTKWRPNWLGSSDTLITKPINSAETSCYDPKQVNIANGELNLTAIVHSCTANGTTYNYRSGMVESNGKYNFTFGYMEARIWTPAGTGVWPAFWADGQNWPTDGEIDVLEAYGTDNSTYHYHYAGCGGNCGPGGSVNVAGATAGWHTYAANWKPGVITWYYDGQQVWQYATAVSSSPMYLILNLGLNSSQPVVPAIMKVDYVRVWKEGVDLTSTQTLAPTLTPTKTMTPTPTPTFTNTPTPLTNTPALTVQTGSTTTVSNIVMTYTNQGINRTIITTPTVVNEANGSPLLSAVIDFNVKTPSGKIYSYAGYTTSSGQVTFSLKSKDLGTYVVTINNITKSGYTYHPTITTKNLVVN